MNKLSRLLLALAVVALSAFFSYQAPHRVDDPASRKPAPAAQVAQPVAATQQVDSALSVSDSPIDFKHILGADYKRHTGEPTGGHTLLHGDVRVIDGTESAPDASGVYRAQVQMADPQHPGQWLTKTDRNGTPMPNTMFPKHWTAEQVVSEVNAAWNSPTKTIRGDKWSALTPSGVRVEGYLAPRVTAYPVYSKRH
ncbi:MAG: EndoU domain-containing protein [Limnohabitans sp.]